MLGGCAGTGKTLVARALAASASRAGRKVAFFMRKGADILSKWVGEAERQLRLLFEEAQRQQPAIIFFDEIDGLAPVCCCSALLPCLLHPHERDGTTARHSDVPQRAM